MSANTENLSAVRRIVLMVGAAGFLSSQLAMQDHDWSDLSDPKSVLIIAGFALWALALMWMVGPWFWRARDAALDDERIRGNRLKAFFVGYIAMVAVSLGVFALGIAGEIEGPEAAQLIFAAGVATPLFAFAFLD